MAMLNRDGEPICPEVFTRHILYRHGRRIDRDFTGICGNPLLSRGDLTNNRCVICDARIAAAQKAGPSATTFADLHPAELIPGRYRADPACFICGRDIGPRGLQCHAPDSDECRRHALPDSNPIPAAAIESDAGLLSFCELDAVEPRQDTTPCPPSPRTPSATSPSSLAKPQTSPLRAAAHSTTRRKAAKGPPKQLAGW